MKRQKPKWIFALRAGVVVALLMCANYYLILKTLTLNDIYYALASGFAWFLVEIVRMYKIRLSPSLNIGAKHGRYTIILGKI